MGAFDDVPTITLPDTSDQVAAEAFRRRWKWDNNELVILHGVYTAAHMEAVQNASAATDAKDKNTPIKYQVGTSRLALIKAMVWDWTFSRNGQKVPITMDSIRALPERYMTPILEQCDKLAGTLTEEEQQSFLNSANGHTSENSSLESLLQMK